METTQEQGLRTLMVTVVAQELDRERAFISTHPEPSIAEIAKKEEVIANTWMAIYREIARLEAQAEDRVYADQRGRRVPVMQETNDQAKGGEMLSIALLILLGFVVGGFVGALTC